LVLMWLCVDRGVRNDEQFGLFAHGLTDMGWEDTCGPHRCGVASGIMVLGRSIGHPFALHERGFAPGWFLSESADELWRNPQRNKELFMRFYREVAVPYAKIVDPTVQPASEQDVEKLLDFFIPYGYTADRIEDLLNLQTTNRHGTGPSFNEALKLWKRDWWGQFHNSVRNVPPPADICKNIDKRG